MTVMRLNARNAGRGLACCLVLALAAGCQYFSDTQGTRSSASAADLAACRRRADDVFRTQNRGAVYLADMNSTSNRDSPFAATGSSAVTGQGLSAQFQRERFVDSCLRSTSSTAPTDTPSAVPAGAATGPAAGPAPASGGASP